MAAETSNFVCSGFDVYDNAGYIVDRNSFSIDTWQVDSTIMSTLGEYNFVLEITSETAGLAIIQVN